MIILKPEPIAAISAGAENLLTPSPKEVFVGGAIGTVSIGLASATPIDTIFLGFTNATPSFVANVFRTEGLAGESPLLIAAGVKVAPDALGAAHLLLQLAAPITAGFLALDYTTEGGPPLRAGILMVGTRFQAPHERGGGRQLIDTGTKERLPDGGIGGEDGVMLASLRWRFVGLSDAVRRQLWALAYDRGERRPVLVIEEPDSEAAGANERIHYATFDRFEAYERADPNQTSWALSVTEWL